MKKLFIIIIAVLLPMLAKGQLLYENDYTGIIKFTGYRFFDDSQTDGKVEVDPDGIAITVGIQTGELWQPQVMVVPDGSFSLKEGGNYKVIITAKFPTSGILRINMGTSSTNDQADFPITATGEFQTVECDFDNWSVSVNGAHILYGCGDFKGTTIIKKILVIDKDLGGTGSDISYNFIPKGKMAEVIPYTNGKYYGAVVIPEKVTHEGREYNVTKITDNAFSYCEDLTSVTIPNSVTSIGQFAFKRCSNLNSIILPNNISSIDNYVFQSCSGLTSVTIPNSVTSIGRGAFDSCIGLTSITIPNNLTSIGECAFQNCIGLTSITIPNSVTSLGNYAFAKCTGLTSFTIPSSISYIGGSMFFGCTSLSSVTIPISVTEIYNSAFSGCTGLTSITIPNSVTTIYDSVFSGCTGLTSFTIPSNITYIGGSMFSGCTGLTSITIPNSVTTICESAFSGCSGLTSVSIPNSVNGIGSQAFKGCNGLTSITIGCNVNYINSLAFANCENLEDVYCLAENVPSTMSDIFDKSYVQYANLHVPSSAINAYQTTDPWSGFGVFKTLSGEAVETKKCATPTISYVNGELTFSCETEGVEYVSELSSSDVGNKYTDKVNITGKITVKVYATKSGYDKSDTAIAEIEVPGELKGDLNNDGIVNVADHVELTKIIMNEY